jgi:hypothetical protein
MSKMHRTKTNKSNYRTNKLKRWSTRTPQKKRVIPDFHYYLSSDLCCIYIMLTVPKCFCHRWQRKCSLFANLPAMTLHRTLNIIRRVSRMEQNMVTLPYHLMSPFFHCLLIFVFVLEVQYIGFKPPHIWFGWKEQIVSARFVWMIHAWHPCCMPNKWHKHEHRSYIETC